MTGTESKKVQDSRRTTTHQPWDTLSKERQIELLEAYNRYLDQLPPTCSMQTKQQQFARWLAEHGVSYP